MVGLAAGGGKRRRWGATPSRQRRALEVGRAFAEIIRDNPVVHELWVTADTEETGIHLWLITDPLAWEAQKRFYGTPSDLIEDLFPREYVWVHVLNPCQHTGDDVHGVLRQDAEQIPLRAD
jgi:hypothetical protein